MSDPCTCSECNAKQNRTAAFGAIQRAAEVARHHDQRHADWVRNGVQDAADQQWFAADSVRRAIRAAIGSDKA